MRHGGDFGSVTARRGAREIGDAEVAGVYEADELAALGGEQGVGALRVRARILSVLARPAFGVARRDVRRAHHLVELRVAAMKTTARRVVESGDGVAAVTRGACE